MISEETKTFKIGIDQENGDVIEYDVDVNCEYETEYLLPEIDGYRGVRLSLKDWEIESINGVFAHHMNVSLYNEIFEKVLEVIYE